MIVLLSIFGVLQSVIAAAAFTILLYYGIANIAALKLSAENKIYPKWIAVLGLISCLALAVSLPLPIIATGLGMLFIGFILRAIFQKINSTSVHTGEPI